MSNNLKRVLLGLSAALALLLVMAGMTVAVQPGETLQDKIESLHRGCGERGESIDRTTSCFVVIPEGEALYVETRDYVSLSGGSEAYFLITFDSARPAFDLIPGPMSLDMEVSDAQWVVAPEYWFDCLPEGEVKLVNGVVHCDFPTSPTPVVLSLAG